MTAVRSFGNAQDVPLLTTKLYIPPPRSNLVPRPRLTERLDEGLHLGHVRHIAPSFVDQLQDYAGISRPEPESLPRPQASQLEVEQPLVEPLSGRELEVLDLIALGLSNREIAERLFIVHGTVKRHINNVYGNLQVQRRTEAVARARDPSIL